MKKLGFAVLLASSFSQAMSIDEYLQQVSKKNKNITSYEVSVEASNEKQVAGDLGLSPVLSAGYSVLSDKSQPSAIADQRDTTTASLGLAKKFSSGTALSLTADTYRYDYEQPVTPGNDGYSNGRLGLSLTQSLWKDSFGSATRLRQNRESLTNKFEKLGFELKRRAALVQAESDYWDYLVAQEDLRLKKANLDRSKKLESWTANRVYNGISEQPDLLQIQALVSLRELQYATAQEELAAKSISIREHLDLKASDTIPEFTSTLLDSRSHFGEMMSKPNMIKIENYLTLVEAELKGTVAEEAKDSLRPDLAFVGRYSTSSYDLDHQTMQNNLTKTDRPVTYVGLSLSWMFGSDAVSSQISSARKEALASKYRADQAKLIGENAWADHLRKYQLNKKNVALLEKIAKLQSERSRQEQIRFSKGRTITTNVVNAETESAEAEVNFLKAKSNLRKLEAATQMYMSTAE